MTAQKIITLSNAKNSFYHSSWQNLFHGHSYEMNVPILSPNKFVWKWKKKSKKKRKRFGRIWFLRCVRHIVFFLHKKSYNWIDRYEGTFPLFFPFSIPAAPSFSANSKLFNLFPSSLFFLPTQCYPLPSTTIFISSISALILVNIWTMSTYFNTFFSPLWHHFFFYYSFFTLNFKRFFTLTNHFQQIFTNIYSCPDETIYIFLYLNNTM